MTDTEAQEIISEHGRIWHRKPTLRRIYREEFSARLISYRRPSGISVELGAGPGFLREMRTGVLLTDVIWSPWLNGVVDAQTLPFKSATIANLMGLDMLHHLAGPLALLREAERVLIPGGRLILVEPWVTPVSYYLPILASRRM
jgi:SAM-dependent methyltransferase